MYLRRYNETYASILLIFDLMIHLKQTRTSSSLRLELDVYAINCITIDRLLCDQLY